MTDVESTPEFEALKKDIVEWLEKMVPQTASMVYEKFKDRSSRMEVYKVLADRTLIDCRPDDEDEEGILVYSCKTEKEEEAPVQHTDVKEGDAVKPDRNSLEYMDSILQESVEYAKEVAREVMSDTPIEKETNEIKHPLQIAFDLAIEQATKGKGVRHGGDSIPFYDQRWKRLADLHGEGFLTGQAQKNFEEALAKEGDAKERGLVEAMVWIAMSVLKSREYPQP